MWADYEVLLVFSEIWVNLLRVAAVRGRRDLPNAIANSLDAEQVESPLFCVILPLKRTEGY